MRSRVPYLGKEKGENLFSEREIESGVGDGGCALTKQSYGSSRLLRKSSSCDYSKRQHHQGPWCVSGGALKDLPCKSKATAAREMEGNA